MNINRFSELFGINVQPQRSVGDRALERCSRFKIDVWKEDSGNVVVGFELHGSIGQFDDDDDEDEGGLKERTDLSLIGELLERFQRKDGDL
jgi:hypothetical protein